MKLLIVSATSDEIKTLKNSLKKESQLSPELERYHHKNIIIDILITGVGMVPTAFRLGKVLRNEKYDFALNLGIAGSFKKEIEIESVVNVKTEIFSELGIEDNENFIPLYKAGFETGGKIFEEGRIMNNSVINNSEIKKLTEVTGITVNTVHGNFESIEKVKRLYSPDIESMEGAAFFFACKNEKTGFAELRSVSNYVEPRNKSNWNNSEAIKNLNNIAMEVINCF
ncbi:MAG: futalosine hydrolase [Bacteroidales bacterium]|nr:futalosine hydrolase [Bacteroidales bacterium]